MPRIGRTEMLSTVPCSKFRGASVLKKCKIKKTINSKKLNSMKFNEIQWNPLNFNQIINKSK